MTDLIVLSLIYGTVSHDIRFEFEFKKVEIGQFKTFLDKLITNLYRMISVGEDSEFIIYRFSISAAPSNTYINIKVSKDLNATTEINHTLD